MAFRPNSSLKSLRQNEFGFAQGSTLAERLGMQERAMEALQNAPTFPGQDVETRRQSPSTTQVALKTVPGKSVNLKDVRHELTDILDHAAQAFEAANPGWKAEAFSGKAARVTGTPNHPAGWGVDMRITDPQGRTLLNRPSDLRHNRNQLAKDFAKQEEFAHFARAYQQANYPKLDKSFRWGGGFSIPDLMHYDLDIKNMGMAAYTWDNGLKPSGRKTLPGAESIGMKQFMTGFPPAPSGPTGWPTPTEKGPGIYGALNPATLAEQYSLANTRYRQPVAATPLDQFRPAPATPQQDFRSQFGPPMSAMDRPQQGPPVSAMTRPQQGPPMSAMTRPQQGPPAPARDYGAPGGPVVGSGGIVGTGSPVIDVNSMMRPTAAAAPAMPAISSQKVKADFNTAFAKDQAYPDEARFSMKPGITPAAAPASTPSQLVDPAVRESAAVARAASIPTDPRAAAIQSMPLTGWTTPPERQVATEKVQPPAAPPRQTEVIKSPVKTVAAPAPAIVAGQPPPEQVGGIFAALQNAVEPVTERLAAPFHTLANLAGPVPNPKSFDYGTGAQAIGDALSGVTQSKPGAVSYSQSTPGYSIKSLGNGMIQKTNQFGHVSFERVGTPGSGILSGQPTSGGLLSNFGLGGVAPTAGGLLSGRNLGGFAGSLLGGAIAGPFGALAGGWLGNKLGSNLGGTAPATGGGLFGGFGGGFGGGKSTGGGKSSGTSGGGKGSMSAGSGSMSKSTRY